MADDAGSPTDIDVLAALLRADSGDVGAYVESLAVKLEGAVPGNVKVERRRAGLLGPKVVRKIAVDAGGERLELVSDGGDQLEARRAHVSGGIVLKSEPLELDAWTEALSEALSQEAARNERTRKALERLLLG
jgi:hypothetical protein